MIKTVETVRDFIKESQKYAAAYLKDETIAAPMLVVSGKEAAIMYECWDAFEYHKCAENLYENFGVSLVSLCNPSEPWDDDNEAELVEAVESAIAGKDYIPHSPNKAYPQWEGWDDFLGIDNEGE